MKVVDIGQRWEVFIFPTGRLWPVTVYRRGYPFFCIWIGERIRIGRKR